MTIEQITLDRVTDYPGSDSAGDYQRFENAISEDLATGNVGIIEVRGHWQDDRFIAVEFRYWSIEDDCWTNEITGEWAPIGVRT
jgi:hypothetical protein